MPLLITLHHNSYQISERSSRCWLVNLHARRSASRYGLQSSGCACTSSGTLSVQVSWDREAING